MNEQIKVQEFLRQKFLEMKDKNPSLSIRSFAVRLEMQPGATNEILKGERRVSRKVVERIADKLLLNPSERTDLLRDFPLQLKRSKPKSNNRERELKVLQLNSHQFELISEWIHLAILSLVRVKDFKSEIDWIGERLGVTALEARKAVIKLQHLNLLHIDEKGTITRTSQPVRTSDDVKDLSIQRMHMNDMDLAKKKIQDIRIDQRDFTNYTFPANPKSLKRAKEILRQAQDDIEQLMNDEEAKEVYRICMYLFPLTNLENEKVNL